jgi:acetyl esterase/lipase
MTSVRNRRPPLDPELAAVLSVVQGDRPLSVTPALIKVFRESSANVAPSLQSLEMDGAIILEQREATAPDGASISMLILRPTALRNIEAPGIYYLHGGGMVMGNARTGIETPLSWALEFGAIVVSAEYRLAPDFPDPVPVEDCYSGLLWVHQHATEIGVDRERILVAGASAGAGLAAGVALMARDRRGPALMGQVLMCPMLDDRNDTPSSYELIGEGIWDRTSNQTGWDALLGARRGGPDVSPYAAPSRAADLSDLPSAFIDAGSAELFRDEAVDYALRLWRAGTQAELHVWPGGFHAFDTIAPQASLSVVSTKTRNAWVGRLLCGP